MCGVTYIKPHLACTRVVPPVHWSGVSSDSVLA